MDEIRKYYWNPRNWDSDFVNEEIFIRAFNLNQLAGVWTDWHEHSTWAELVVLLSGSVTTESESGNYLANSRQCVWLPPRVPHDFYTLEPCLNRTLYFHESLFRGNPRFSTVQVIPLSPLLQNLILAGDDGHLDLSTEKGRRAGLFLWDVIERSEQVTSSQVMPHDRRLQKICASVISEPDKDIDIESWCRSLGMSSKTLSRIFFRETGTTFGTWVRRTRLDYARSLLEEGRSVTEAALSCGYTSLSSFITAFKKAFGCTPGAVSHPREYPKAGAAPGTPPAPGKIA